MTIVDLEGLLEKVDNWLQDFPQKHHRKKEAIFIHHCLLVELAVHQVY